MLRVFFVVCLEPVGSGIRFFNIKLVDVFSQNAYRVFFLKHSCNNYVTKIIEFSIELFKLKKKINNIIVEFGLQSN